MARPVEPAESSRGIRRGIRELDLGESGLYIRLPDEVTIARDLASDILATERGSAVEGLLNRLNSKVSVAAVNYLEEGNLRIAG